MDPVDRETLDRRIQEHLPDGMRLAIRLTGDAHRAEDLLQEALLRVAGSWTSYRGEASFRTWFTRIVINAFRDQLRNRSRAVAEESLQGETESPEAAPVERLMAEELNRRIADCVSRLPPRQREVTVLLSYEGFSVAEVAELLRISEANVHATHHQARQRLRQLLEPYSAGKRK